jgi:hypothetical protein
MTFPKPVIVSYLAPALHSPKSIKKMTRPLGQVLKTTVPSSSFLAMTCHFRIAHSRRRCTSLAIQANWQKVVTTKKLIIVWVQYSLCTVFKKFGSTAINCPRSLQILCCQKLLFCTLQRIHSSVALLPDYLVKKSCNSGEDWIAVCKPVFSTLQENRIDCKILVAQIDCKNHHQKIATKLDSEHLNCNNCKLHSRIQLHWKSLYRK